MAPICCPSGHCQSRRLTEPWPVNRPQLLEVPDYGRGATGARQGSARDDWGGQPARSVRGLAFLAARLGRAGHVGEVPYHHGRRGWLRSCGRCFHFSGWYFGGAGPGLYRAAGEFCFAMEKENNELQRKLSTAFGSLAKATKWHSANKEILWLSENSREIARF